MPSLSHPTTAPTPERPAKASPVLDPRAVIGAFAAVLTRPAKFFATAAVREQEGFGRPLVFAVVMVLAGGVIGSVTDVFLGATGVVGPIIAWVILSPIPAVLGVFVGGAVVHFLGHIAGASGTLEQSVRIACYATAVFPVAVVIGEVPILSPVAMAMAHLYATYIVATGLIALEAANRRRAFLACGIVAVAVPLLGLLASRLISWALYQLLGGM